MRNASTHIVQSVSVHSLSSRDDQVGRGTIHAVTRYDHFSSRFEDGLDIWFTIYFVDAKDSSAVIEEDGDGNKRRVSGNSWKKEKSQVGECAHVDTRVNVGRAIQRIKDNSVFPPVHIFNNDSFFIFL